MTARLRRLPVTEVVDVGGKTYRLSLGPAPGPPPAAAQFYMLRPVHWALDPLLGRPFSIAEYQEGPGGLRLDFLLKVCGRGTAALAEMEAGQEIEVLGPLGHGFPEPDRPNAEVWLVAGGIGMAPFPLWAKRLGQLGHRVQLLLGARSADEVPGPEVVGLPVEDQAVATDDGSAGFAGTVVALMEQRFGAGRPDVVYICGPDPMMAAAARSCSAAGVRSVVSLEAPMACGMGTCRGCVIVDASGRNFTICTDGPVADGERIYGVEPGSPGHA